MIDESSLYRTYEGLKRTFQLNHGVASDIGLYRTYEGLKPV